MHDFTAADRSYAELMLKLDLKRDFEEGDRFAIHWEVGGFGRVYHVWCGLAADPRRAGTEGKRIYVWLPPLGYWVTELVARGCLPLRFNAFDRSETPDALRYYIEAQWKAEDGTEIHHTEAQASLEEAAAALHARVTGRLVDA